MKKVRDPRNSTAAGKIKVFRIGLESKGAAKDHYPLLAQHFQMEKRLLTILLPSLGALPGGGKGARPTFTAGGAAQVGPALAGAGTIP